MNSHLLAPAVVHMRPGIPVPKENMAMAETTESKAGALGIDESIAVPLIALVATSIGALVVVLVLLSRDRKKAG